MVEPLLAELLLPELLLAELFVVDVVEIGELVEVCVEVEMMLEGLRLWQGN